MPRVFPHGVLKSFSAVGSLQLHVALALREEGMANAPSGGPATVPAAKETTVDQSAGLQTPKARAGSKAERATSPAFPLVEQRPGGPAATRVSPIGGLSTSQLLMWPSSRFLFSGCRRDYSDQQLAIVMEVAAQVPYQMRARYLHAVADAVTELGLPRAAIFASLSSSVSVTASVSLD